MSPEQAAYTKHRLAILVLLVSGFIFLLDLSLPFGIAAEVSYLVLVLLSLLSHRKTVTYYTATVGTALSLVGGALSPQADEWMLVLANRSLAASALWVTAILCVRQKSVVNQLHHEKGLLARVSAIVESSEDAIIGQTLDERITSWNAGAEQLFGYSTDEVIGRSAAFLIPPDREGELDSVFARLRQGEATDHFDTMRRTKDGSLVEVSLNLSPIRDASGQIVGASNIARDVTRQKEAERSAKQARLRIEQQARALAEQTEQLQLARRQAEQANAAKSEFLANMSHEIRTPMTAILGFAELLMTDENCPVSPRQADAIETIIRNGNHLLEVINDILDLSKIEAGKIEVESIECSPRQIVNDVASLMRVRADAKGIPLHVHVDGSVPETVLSDPTRLRQILINLTGNAIKFTKSGRVELAVRFLSGDGRDSKLQFDVIDSGIGMSEGQVARLFQPFTQADSSTTREYGGTGLGLVISKRLAEMLGGTITVQSRLNQGSAFRLTVATAVVKAESQQQEAEEGETASSAHQPSTAGPPSSSPLDCRVLLAEDGPDNQRLISFVLKKAGADVVVATNGREAYEMALLGCDEQGMPIAYRAEIGSADSRFSDFGSRPYDVVLMDMQMPILDGYSATRKLREAGYAGPIIALTAHAMSGDRQKCLDAGCDDYMTKPIDRQKLVSLVAEYAHKSSAVIV